MRCAMRFDCIERPLARLFNRYGQTVSKYPWPFILLPLLLTTALALGILHLDEVRLLKSLTQK